MCGICGIGYADGRPPAEARLDRMVELMAHRGPDDCGTEVFGGVGLGHARLSIVDLSHGHQPMSNEDGSVWVVFNGEIYNHQEIRDRLVARGHEFRTRCDTEAIVHLYEERGLAFVEELRGMFALAVHDRRRQRLVMARDRLGIKPLFYLQTPDGDLAFASEIPSLFASGLIQPAIRASAVAEFMATGHVAGERTLLEDVTKLSPGTLLVWESGRTTRRRFWPRDGDHVDGDRRSRESALTSPPEESRPEDDFWDLFVESVRLRLMADVPLGVFLSGGMDSGLIAAAMRQCGVEELLTFSVGYEDSSASELPAARTTAEALGTRHHELKLSPEDFFGSLPRLTKHHGFPLTFSASAPLAHLSVLASSEVKVVLTGEGADELFAGYGRYVRALLNIRGGRLLDRVLPGSVRRGLSAAATRMGKLGGGRRIQRSFLTRSGTVEEAYLDAFSIFDREARRDLLLGRASNGEDTATRGALDFLDQDLVRENLLEALLRLDQRTYLEELLAKQDHMSMYGSIESRVPYLDQVLVDWARSLPPGSKLRFGKGKALVRSAARQHLPASIVEGPKRGFTLPLASWLRGEGRAFFESYVPASGDEYFDASYVRGLMDRHQEGEDWADRLWLLLAFQVWRQDVVPCLYEIANTDPHRATPATSRTI